MQSIQKRNQPFGALHVFFVLFAECCQEHPLFYNDSFDVCWNNNCSRVDPLSGSVVFRVRDRASFRKDLSMIKTAIIRVKVMANRMTRSIEASLLS